MATKLHSTLTGTDLHVNKIDGTTGTELTAASEMVYDARWVKQTGGTITVPSGGLTAGLAVTQNDTTNNPRGIDVAKVPLGCAVKAEAYSAPG